MTGQEDCDGWWVVVVRIGAGIDTEENSGMEEFSLRLVKADRLEDAKSKACLAALAANPDSTTIDGRTIRHAVKSIVGAEYLGERAPGDGDEVWSRFAFNDREEDQPYRGNSAPYWVLRAFHTDWNVSGLEEPV